MTNTSTQGWSLHCVCGFSGEVVQTEPLGWREAVTLEEDDLQSWEGPSKEDVAKDVATEVGQAHKRWFSFFVEEING